MNKKGFTLVELLAVVVILALILAIAVPAITNITTTAKKNMFENSSKMILKSMKNDYDGKIASIGSFTDTFILYDNGVRTVYPSSNNIDFTINATDGGIVRNSDGSVAFALYDGTNCAIKTRTSNDVTVTTTDKASCISNIIYKQASTPFPNLVTNGDFSNGTTGWNIGTSITNVSTTNGVLSFTTPGDTLYTGTYWISQPNLFTNYTHNFYVSLSVRQTNGTGSSFVTANGYNQNVNFVVLSNMLKYSSVFTPTNLNSNSSYFVIGTRSGAKDSFAVDNIILVNLTSTYGSGNEPTAIQMDNNINKAWIDTANGNTPKRFTAGGWVNF